MRATLCQPDRTSEPGAADTCSQSSSQAETAGDDNEEAAISRVVKLPVRAPAIDAVIALTSTIGEGTLIATIFIAVCALAIAVVGRATLDRANATRPSDVEPSGGLFPSGLALHPFGPLQREPRADAGTSE